MHWVNRRARSACAVVTLAAGLAIAGGATALALDGAVLISSGAESQSGGDILRVDAATGTVTTLATGNNSSCCFSPDGKQIAYFSRDGGDVIRIMNNDGTNNRILCNGHTPYWTTGNHIMWGTATQVFRADVATGYVEVATTFPDVGWFSVSYDGTRGAATMTPAGAPHLQVWKFDLITGQTASLGDGCQGTISPNGQLITHNQLSHTECEIHNWDGSRHAWITAPPGEQFVTHRFSHVSNDYIVYVQQYSNPGRAYVCDIRTNTSYKIGDLGIPWDFWPGALPPPGPGAVAITSTPSAEAYVGVPYSYHVIVTASPAPTVSVSGYPAWLSWDAGTSTLSGTPSAADVGTTGTIAVTATNASGSDSQQFQITVSNTGPRIVSIAPTTATEDVLYSYRAQAVGDPTPTITVSGLPAWLTFDGTDTISGVPSISDVGATDTITVTATNSAGTATQEFVINILQAPEVEILSPVAGDVWYVGTTQRVEWSTINISNVVVAYSTDGGASYNVINPSIADTDPAWGMLSWAVVDVPSTQCVTRIAGYLGEAPKLSGTFEIRSVTDLDGDGMDDGWELDAFGDTSRDGEGDYDGDAWSDLDEFMYGSDPADPADVPLVPAAESPGGGDSGVSCAPWGGRGAAGLSFALTAFALALMRMMRGGDAKAGI